MMPRSHVPAHLPFVPPTPFVTAARCAGRRGERREGRGERGEGIHIIASSSSSSSSFAFVFAFLFYLYIYAGRQLACAMLTSSALALLPIVHPILYNQAQQYAGMSSFSICLWLLIFLPSPFCLSLVLLTSFLSFLSFLFRPSAGSCDAAEKCNGISMDCPSDQMQSNGTICRFVLLFISLSSPSDLLLTPFHLLLISFVSPFILCFFFLCRSAAGPCDVAEKCTGISPSCPVNAFSGKSVICRY